MLMSTSLFLKGTMHIIRYARISQKRLVYAPASIQNIYNSLLFCCTFSHLSPFGESERFLKNKRHGNITLVLLSFYWLYI